MDKNWKVIEDLPKHVNYYFTAKMFVLSRTPYNRGVCIIIKRIGYRSLIL